LLDLINTVMDFRGEKKKPLKISSYQVSSAEPTWNAVGNFYLLYESGFF